MRKHMRRAYKLEGNSDSGKLFERIRAVLSARVYDRVCLGQFSVALMVIRYHKIDAAFLCGLCLIHRGYSRINGNYERDPFGGKLSDPLCRHAVSFRASARNVVPDIASDLAKKHIKNADRGNSVNVVIPVNDRFLVLVGGAEYTLRAELHVLHEKRIVEHLRFLRKKSLYLVRCSVTPVVQNSRGREKKPDLFCDVPYRFLGSYPFGRHTDVPSV